jgi:hypothetical protein
VGVAVIPRATDAVGEPEEVTRLSVDVIVVADVILLEIPASVGAVATNTTVGADD